MEPVENVVGLMSLLHNIKDELSLLVFSGVGGAVVRALFTPEAEWKRRIAQGLGGAISAMFLGGLAAQMFNHIVNDTGPYAYLAFGFLMGSGGEVAIKRLQDKLLGTPK
tara:strand:- start:1835 stop:2161 length:327 start_codon:yes stop_codon:yes gene_type:complete